MKCINCQNEINENSVYCSFCGKPTSIVPDYSIYDEDNLKVLLESAENVQSQKEKEEILKEEQRKIAEQKRIAAEQKREEIRKAKLLEKKKKKQTQMTIFIIALVCVLLIVVGVFAKMAIDHNNSNSFDYQIKMASTSVKEGDYKTAVYYYKRAIDLKPRETTAHMALVEVYWEMDETQNALALLHKIVTIDSSAYDAYKELISYYEKNEDIDAILALLKGVTDSRAKNLFSNYIVTSPNINLAGGKYSKSIRVTLSAKMGNSIYYTLDGSDPEKKGTLYSQTIVLDKQGTYTLKAVAKNERGVFSEVVSEKYIIAMEAPDDPVISLTKTGEIIQSGNFKEETSISIFVPTGCSAYFTWDNTDPTTETGTLYTEPLIVPEGHHILSVIIIDNENKLQSSIFRGIFDYYPEDTEE